MACMPIAGLTALQALVTHGQLQEGESVLLNGSSGGVGHLAVQIAKARGAKVTAVCSKRNVDFVKALDADQFTARANTGDLETLGALIQEGKVVVHVERSYAYKEIPEAIRHIEAMRTRGKVAMVWENVEAGKNAGGREQGAIR